jgi:parallel beta-helix repeat protein
MKNAASCSANWRRNLRAQQYARRSIRCILAALAFFPLALLVVGSPAAALEENIGSAHGLTANGIAQAIDDAKRDFAAHPDDTVTLYIGPGRYDLSQTSGERGVINVSGIHPGDRGRLIIRGAGPTRTTLVFDRNAAWIFGRNVYHVSFVGLRMTASQYTVSQGHVVSVTPGAVVLAIEDGFPSPGDLFNPDRQGHGAGRFLRRYVDSATDPHRIETDNQIAWSAAQHLSGKEWRMVLQNAELKPDYRPGDFVCIKSKPHGNAYWFAGGDDIAFDHIVWSLKARGVFRGGIGNVRIANSAIERAPPINGHVPCLSTPGGGPQIGQPHDRPVSGNIVENNTFDATGDDAIAFFNASGIIRNNTVSDSFARGILLARSPSVKLDNNRLNRCPLLQRSGPARDEAPEP